MIGQAIKRYERASPRKVNRILEILRGKTIPEARALLQMQHTRTRLPVMKTLNSAVANLKFKVGAVRIDDKDLIVKEARIDEGPIMKRWRPGFRGTADMIRRRTCHIKFTVASIKPIKEKKGG